MGRRLLLAAACVLSACGTEQPDPGCPTVAAADCTAQYDPTFANIHERTLSSGCAVSGAACHASGGAAGGFSLNDIEDAYTNLTIYAEGECSVLARRLASSDPAFQMPPGKPLDETELCAIAKWIDAGAPR